jgi:NADH-quinone oxidoreductase subunit M
MLNHGVSTGALFLIVGMVYERRHTRMIADFGGLAQIMPVFATFFMIVALSSIALPGTNGFVGEFLILLGAFQANPVYGVLGATGVILAAAYMLWMFQRVMFGAITHEENRGLKDLNLREIVILVPIIIMIVWMGVFPTFFFKKMDLSVQRFIYDIKARYAAATTAAPAESGPVVVEQDEHGTMIPHVEEEKE